ncbi:MAG TPA: ABC transporter permease [Kineosporiaceae bacterium]|jgi:peptide/nickel transport system permease protein|nr:ABC transporter permease [Kineosporiaceae bacterium]
MPDIQSDQVAVPGPVAGPVADVTALTDVEREFTIKARSQRELVTRRFFRHRGAMGGLIVFVFVLLLAYSSVGFLGIPGWWGQSYETTGTVVNGGSMTLDLLPPFVDGDWFAVGAHPFGQDDVGRDYFALTMRGTQISIVICVSVGLISTALGVLVGAFSGFYRGWVESVLMRFTDLIITIPLLVIASVAAVTFSGGNPLLLALVLGVLLWPNLARLVRGEFLSLREKEFVEAARAMGAPSGRIIFKHILPNTLGTIIVNATLTISAAIILETALSFLGFGVQPPDTSLGKLISDYQQAFTTRPWLFWWPGMFIVAIALSVNFIGDGLRDAFDPKQTRVRA